MTPQSVPCHSEGQCKGSSNFDLKKDCAAVLTQLEHPDGKFHVCQIAPAFFPAISEEFGLPPGTISVGQLVEAFHLIGFQHVFDLRFAADVTIMEEGTELLERVKKGGPFPMFTSCCAGWMRMAEAQYPDLIPHLSSCKSPMSMSSAIIKTYFAQRVGIDASNIVVTSMMPCTLKKQEAKRPQLLDEFATDHVLTTKEIGQLFRAKGIRWEDLDGTGPEAQFSSLSGAGSGAGALFGVTGGVMEAAIRSAYELVTKQEFPGIVYDSVRGLESAKEGSVEIPGLGKLEVCVVSGATNVKRMLDQTRAGECPYHFVEIMMCSSGCINGPGQPRSHNHQIVKKRMEALYTADERATIRKSHENPLVHILYNDFLEEPLSHVSHHLLHTEFKALPPVEEKVVLMSVEAEKPTLPLGPAIQEVLVLYGSETGNSEGVARNLAKDLSKRGVGKVKCMEADKMDVEELPNAKWLIVVISTAGQGDFPENSKEFWDGLCQSSRASDFLSGINFAVFGLGDSSYPMFCKAAIYLDNRLKELGATRFLARGVGNDQDEERFETGLNEWLPLMWDVLQLPEPQDDSIAPPSYDLVLKPGNKENLKLRYEENWKPILTDETAHHIKLVSNTRITSADYDRDARHLVFDMNTCYFKYAVGDVAALYPRNDPQEVVDFLRWYGCEPTDEVQLRLADPEFSGKKKPVIPDKATLQDLFTDVVDIFGRPNGRFLESLSKFATDEKEKAHLKLMTTRSPEGKESYSKFIAETPNFADILRLFPSCKPSLAHLVELVPVIKPRFYSIASSQHWKPRELELSIVVNDWTNASGKVCIGTNTNYIRKLNDHPHWVAIALRPSVGLCMPFNPKMPMLMAGLGTGLAPMRAMVQEREWQIQQGKQVGESVLFFGCRHRSKDYLYGDQWEDCLKRGVLTGLRVAFSRDQKKKVYIQNKIEEVPEQVYDILGVKGGYFMYCGSAGQVPKDIRTAIEGAFVKAGRFSKEQASKKIDELISTGHYVVEAWT